MVFAQVSSLPSVGAGSNFPIEGLQLFSRELGDWQRSMMRPLISLDPCGSFGNLISDRMGNGQDVMLIRMDEITWMRVPGRNPPSCFDEDRLDSRLPRPLKC